MKILKRFIVCVLLILVAGSLALRLTGFTPYAITTQSMEPKISVNSLVYVKEIEFNDIKENDVITYIATDGVTVTHRVVNIDYETQTVITKGDNNEYADALIVTKDRIIGKVYLTIPALGCITNIIGVD